MNYHQGRNSGPNLDGGEEIRTPVNFVHPWESLGDLLSPLDLCVGGRHWNSTDL